MAVLIKVNGGKRYVNIVGKLRKEINLNATKATVICARVTENGKILIGS